MINRIIVFLVLSVGVLANDIADLEKECSENNYNSCRKIGFANVQGLYEGVKIKKDFKKSVSFLKKSCDEGKDSESCAVLGMVYLDLKEKENMLNYLSLSCNNYDHHQACKMLSSMYYKGLTKEQIGSEFKIDHKKALTYSKKSCDLGDIYSCETLNKLDPGAFDNIPNDDIKTIEATLLNNPKLIPTNNRSMATILNMNNNFKKERNFFKVLTEIKIFNRRVYYFGLRGVDLVPGVNAVVDGNAKTVAMAIEKKYGIKFISKKGGKVYTHKLENHYEIVISPHHWKDTSYIIAAYFGP